VDVACVGVAHAVLHRDGPGAGQGFWHGGTGQKVVDRLLLYGMDAEPA
jgi:hypothetical protein